MKKTLISLTIILFLLIFSCEETKVDDQIARGKILFHSTALSANNDIACMNCHPYGNVDRRNWDVGLSDGNGGTRKWDTQTLWGVDKTAPYLWDGSVSSLKETIRHVVDVVMGQNTNPPISESDLDDLTAFTASFPVPISPFLNTDGSMTDLQKKGKKIFEDPNRGNCTKCHFGESFTDNKKWKVGNFWIETPSLLAMWDTHPFWHNGKFKTVWDLLEGHTWIVGPNDTISPALSFDEKKALEAYLNAL